MVTTTYPPDNDGWGHPVGGPFRQVRCDRRQHQSQGDKRKQTHVILGCNTTQRKDEIYQMIAPITGTPFTNTD